MEKVVCTNCEAENPVKSRYCSNCGYELPKIQVETESRQIETAPRTRSVDKKKLGVSIVGVLTFFLAYFAVQQIFFKTDAIDREMMTVASEINKTCPVMVDSETRLDNVVALPDNVFQYNYTLVNISKSDVDTVGMRSYIETNIINMAKTSPQMQYQRDHRWVLNYCYKDKSGLFILMIVVTPTNTQATEIYTIH